MPPHIAPPYRHLEFMSPLSAWRAGELAQFIAKHADGSVVDMGCGWAALLIRLLVTNGSIKGLGLDLDDQGFTYAMEVASARGVSDRLQLVAGDAKANAPAVMGGAICIGSTQIWATPAVASMPMNYRAALTSLRSRVAVGSPVVYGEAIWSAEPTPAAVEPLSGRLDEFVYLPDLLDLACKAGFAVVQVHEANQDEWDEFESGYVARYVEWLAANQPTHPQYSSVVERIQRQRNAYFRGYRGVLGMAYLCLLAI